MGVNSKERQPGESIAQWKQRLKWLNRNGTYATIEPAIVRADSSSISQDRRVLGRKPNDYGVSSNAPIQRQYIENPSIVQKTINGITDALHITRPPTFTDGYGVERNAEVPLSESAQGQELKRMGNTALTGLGIVTMPTIVGGLIKAPLATAAMLGAGTAADKGTKTFLNGVNNHLQNVKLSQEQINTAGFLASLPAMGAANRWGHGVTRRGLETIMHTSGDPNPLPAAQGAWKNLQPAEKANVLDYVFTGRFTPGSNTLNRYKGEPAYYTAFNGAGIQFSPKPGMDAVRTYLYGEPLADLTEVKKPNYGQHEDYILKNYPGKNIKMYESQMPNPSEDSKRSIVKASSDPKHIMTKGRDSSIGLRGNSGYWHNYDAAGHLAQQGLVDGELYQNEQDIWKFNPNDYIKKWGSSLGIVDGKPLNPDKGKGWIRNIPLKWGLRIVDHYGTPFIIRTPWTRTIERNSIINDFVPFNEEPIEISLSKDTNPLPVPSFDKWAKETTIAKYVSPEYDGAEGWLDSVFSTASDNAKTSFTKIMKNFYDGKLKGKENIPIYDLIKENSKVEGSDLDIDL